MLEDKKIYAHKLIQTRKVENGSMTIGCILNLITDLENPKDGLPTPINSAPYFYVGSTNDVGYFILAELINERALLELKRNMETKERNFQNNIVQFVRHHDGKL